MIVIPNRQKGRVRFREVKWLAQGHIANKYGRGEKG